jgi:hypothetical protein
MELTKEEEEIILAKRRKEDEFKPKKTGILKHDLFPLGIRGNELRFDISDIIKDHGWFITKQVVLGITGQVKKQLLTQIIPDGTKFLCYIRDGDEFWYDENDNISEMDSEWADENLINIKTVGKI